MDNQAKATIATGDEIDVRHFAVEEAMSRLFQVELEVVSRNLDIDIDGVVGLDAHFSLARLGSLRSWSGVCTEMEQVRVDRDGLATYRLVVAPRATLLTLRKNYRIFQFKSELDIVRQLLGEWGIEHRVDADGGAHKPRKLRTQYAESDWDFCCRMLEDAGISFSFEDGEAGSVLVLCDEPQARVAQFSALPFFDEPGTSDHHFVTKVRPVQRVRPGTTTIGDLDYRRASTQQPRQSGQSGLPVEARLEQFDYEPGAFLYQGGAGSGTPTADDRGASRTDEVAGAKKAKNRLLGRRRDARQVAFESDLIELGPGAVVGIVDHPHPIVGTGELLVVGSTIAGRHNDAWRVQAVAVGTDTPLRPEPVTPKPRVRGLESATVVGPASEEIHTDEFARVRVHFHWDRESGRDDKSSCWVPTNQPWAGAGFGGTVVPRVGQEVMVEFLGGDPDRPVVVGRVYTEHQPPPYRLPEGKTVTGLVGRSTPHLVLGGAMNAMEVLTTQGAGPGPAFRAKPPKVWGGMGSIQLKKTNNAFLLEDQTGENLVFLQAERDLNLLVKNAWKTIVGNYRGTIIGADDILEVRNKQFVNILAEDHLKVFGDQTIIVDHDREEDIGTDQGLIVSKNTRVLSKGVIDHKAKKAILIEAGESIKLMVGSSSITFTTKEIVVQSPKVTINDTCRR